MPITDPMNPEQAQRMMALVKHITLASEMEKKTDDELVALLMELWGQLPIDSHASAVIGEAIARIKGEPEDAE